MLAIHPPPQEPQIPLQPRGTDEKNPGSVPAAALLNASSHELHFVFMIFSPVTALAISYCRYWAAIYTFHAQNTGVDISFNIAFLARQRRHRTYIHAFFTANTWCVIDTELPFERQPITDKVYKILQSANRAKESAESSSALRENPKNEKPKDECEQ